METSGYALLISIISVSIAGIALGWNIYRDLQKPRFKVDIGFNVPFGEEGAISEPLFTLSGTNFGPGKIKLIGISLKPRWAKIKLLFKRARFGFLIHDYKNPLSNQLPCDVEVGESKNFVLIFNEDCFLKDNNFVRIGIFDSFRRTHWVTRRKYKDVKKQYKEKFKNLVET